MDASTKLTVNGIAMEGTVLAPRAAIEFNNGRVYGNIIGASLNGNGNPMNVKFSGETGLPQPTSPAATPTIAPTPTPTVASTPSPTPAPVLERTTLDFCRVIVHRIRQDDRPDITRGDHPDQHRTKYGLAEKSCLMMQTLQHSNGSL
ncbi:collagen-binding domain-containing protein [Paenibacillus rhizoplanae]